MNLCAEHRLLDGLPVKWAFDNITDVNRNSEGLKEFWQNLSDLNSFYTKYPEKGQLNTSSLYFSILKSFSSVSTTSFSERTKIEHK